MVIYVSRTRQTSSQMETDALGFITNLISQYQEIQLDEIAEELTNNPQIELPTGKLLTFLQDHRFTSLVTSLFRNLFGT